MKIRNVSLLITAVLTGCGGGGTSTTGSGTSSNAGSTPVITPSLPATPPVANPTTVTLTPLSVSSETVSGAGRRISDAADGGPSFFTIRDPDNPSASRIEDINFDGDETLHATLALGLGDYSEDLQSTDYVGSNTDNPYLDHTGHTRNVPAMGWQARRGSSDSPILGLRNLEEVRKTPTTAVTTANVTDHVRLFDMRVSARRGFQVLGSRAAATDIPATGRVTFVGEVYGSAFRSNGMAGEFVGDAVIIADFANGSVTGTIDASQFLFDPNFAPPFHVEFAATMNGGSFEAHRVTMTGFEALQAGTLRGAFFGSAADEMGIVLSTSGASGNIVAGLVAGKE